MSRESDLVQIAQRIRAMMIDDREDIQTRHFDAFGVTVVTVVYDRPSKVFAVEGLRDNNRRFAFDDADLVAIDIYDALQDFKETF